ncbi:hypothetical protein RIF29_18922 [Crotalaria pallida]|uniref:Uncharacterized protein n=1 Tax=Crotalaria pallida TaxID=3830 RepID=A0AAN9EYK0_CROPI
MEAQLKRPLHFKEVYVQIHKKKDGEFVSERSKNFIESYDSKMNEKYGEDSAAHSESTPVLTSRSGT